MPNYQKHIVYLSDEQRQELFTNGSITVNGRTITYSDNDMYVTPQETPYVKPANGIPASDLASGVIPAVPVTDVQVNGTSVLSNSVANVPVASESALGVVKVNANKGTRVEDGVLATRGATDGEIKSGTNVYKPICPIYQHSAAFYGLAKAAGDTTQSQSDNAVGTYTSEAKAAIRTMLGAAASGDIPSVPVQDVQVNGTSVLSNGVANVPLAAKNVAGAVKIWPSNGITIGTGGGAGDLSIVKATPQDIKPGSNSYLPIVPNNQHISAFYGLAKAAGDSTQSASSNAIGTYTSEAKSAIRSMLGAANADDIVAVQDTQPTSTDNKIWLPETAPASVEVPTVAEMNSALANKVSDVQMNGTSVVSNGVANVPYAQSSVLGVVKAPGTYGISVFGGNSAGILATNPASADQIKAGNSTYNPISPVNAHATAFYGLARAAGDTTQKSSSNTIGTYTAEAKTAIQTMLGIDLSSIVQQVEIPLVETVSGTTPSITGQPNTRYNCGEVSTITITPPASGSIDVIFESGSTAAVLTVPNTVKFPSWFDVTSLDTNTIYEILITDGVYGSVMTWAA